MTRNKRVIEVPNRANASQAAGAGATEQHERHFSSPGNVFGRGPVGIQMAFVCVLLFYIGLVFREELWAMSREAAKQQHIQRFVQHVQSKATLGKGWLFGGGSPDYGPITPGQPYEAEVSAATAGQSALPSMALLPLTDMDSIDGTLPLLPLQSEAFNSEVVTVPAHAAQGDGSQVDSTTTLDAGGAAGSPPGVDAGSGEPPQDSEGGEEDAEIGTEEEQMAQLEKQGGQGDAEYEDDYEKPGQEARPPDTTLQDAEPDEAAPAVEDGTGDDLLAVANGGMNDTASDGTSGTEGGDGNGDGAPVNTFKDDVAAPSDSPPLGVPGTSGDGDGDADGAPVEATLVSPRGGEPAPAAGEDAAPPVEGGAWAQTITTVVDAQANSTVAAPVPPAPASAQGADEPPEAAQRPGGNATAAQEAETGGGDAGDTEPAATAPPLASNVTEPVASASGEGGTALELLPLPGEDMPDLTDVTTDDGLLGLNRKRQLQAALGRRALVAVME